MIQLEIPYTYENSSNPWLMDKMDDIMDNAIDKATNKLEKLK